MNLENQSANSIYTMFNGLGVAVAYGMMAITVWMAPIDLSTKGIFGMGVFLLTLSLVNVVKYRMDDRSNADRVNQLEAAKNEKLLTDFVSEN